jgi:hypothetical protein
MVEISYIHTLHSQVCVAYPCSFKSIGLRSNFYSYLSMNCLTCICESDIYMIRFIETELLQSLKVIKIDNKLSRLLIFNRKMLKNMFEDYINYL